ASNGGTLDINTPLTVTGQATLASQSTSTISVAGDLLGDTGNATAFGPLGKVLLDGTGTATSPRLLEVMASDMGATASGFTNNFAYGTLSLGSNNYVRLVDRVDNATGTGAEALYVNMLIVPTGSTLDLNGLPVYARAVQNNGTIVGGTVALLKD